MGDALPAAGKRGELTGGALTDEALDSSKSVLGLSYGNAQRGLQQFFSTHHTAEFIKAVIDPQGRCAVVDPTAGSGELLAPWKSTLRFGVEIDNDWVRQGNYTPITGDLQRAFPMLFKLGVTFTRIVANPPFGLTWTDGSGYPESSTAGTWRRCLGLLDANGVGAFICGADRFHREILTREDAAGIFAVVECEDLFDKVELAHLIAFFVKPENTTRTGEPLTLRSSRDDLADPTLQEQVRAAMRGHALDISEGSWVGPAGPWRLVDEELARRRREQEKNQQTHDVQLRGTDRLSVKPCPYVRKALAKANRLKLVERLHNQPVGHFALNGLDWTLLTELQDECDLTIAPAVTTAVERVSAEAVREVIPLYEVRPQMRLGYLTDLDAIECVQTDDERGFTAGETYPLKTDSKVNVTKGQKVTYNKRGEPIVRKFEEEAKVLEIKIDAQLFTEAAHDIEYILQHFAVPNPGDIATRFPDEVQHQREILDAIADSAGEKGGNPNFQWKRFQREDLARAATKTKDGGGFILSWEQGGGKTLGAAGYALAAVQNGAKDQVLFIVPQDLIDQYRADIKDNLGIRVEHITTPKQARQVAKHLREGGTGWYIVHYEVLSLLGAKNEALPPVVTYRRNEDDGRRITLDSSEFCPRCQASFEEGWQKQSPHVCAAVHPYKVNGEVRRRSCGYVHKALKVKPAAHYLSAAFADGVICIDEGTLIKGDTSQRSKAIRGLRARNRLLATGTPISNYVNQIFWLMWWCLGDSSLRFPYSYRGGLAAFESDFCVLQYLFGRSDGKNAHKREQRRVLPKVTNVSRFWRLVAAAMIRRRKADFGEPVVPCTLKTVSVPMGVAQHDLYKLWLDKGRFASFFAWKFPGHPLVSSGQIERFAAACGQLTKLEYATTCPEAATDREWPGVELMKHSNWTPKSVKTLEVILKHVQNGEKVLVGSDLIETGRWLCDRLTEKGIRAGHIVEERDGKASTVNPKKRARVMRDFRHGGLQVLLCGIPAIRLGHNLDTASVVVVDGLVFSYEMFDQFVARVHRLSSTKPVTVYVMLTKGGLDEKKWELLCQKAEAADLALDGQLMDEREDPISLEQVLKDLQKQGVPLTGEEIDETEVKAMWEAIPHIALAPPVDASRFEQINEGPAPMTRTYRPVKPIKSSEQLSLFG